MLPQTEAFKRISYANGSLCLTDSAKALQEKRNNLIDFLSKNKWIYRRLGNKNWVGYSDKIQQGLLIHKVTTVETTDGDEKVCEQVRITPKGLAKLALIFDVVLVNDILPIPNASSHSGMGATI